MDREALIHFIGGAVGGTAGTALTCPLEVVKTRLQSSKHGFSSTSSSSLNPPSGKPSTSQTNFSNKASPKITISNGPKFSSLLNYGFQRAFLHTSSKKVNNGYPQFCELQRAFLHTSSKQSAWLRQPMLVKHFMNIITTEGISSLYKGLLPNLVGVAPSKAVYFYTYSSSKRFCNQLDIFVPNTAIVHMLSAGFAGFITATVINPVWLVKTRLQLHHGPLSIRECIKRIYQREGFKGYYKGVTASYMGISETIIQFVLYEYLRAFIDDYHYVNENKKFLNFMVAGGCAKFIACIIAYPHEVVRTRLREEGSNSKGFFKTLKALYREGRVPALYRGLSVQLLRSVPNTAITMGAYETVVYFLHTYVA
jgi:solute carrier family 25 protein 33/36